MSGDQSDRMMGGPGRATLTALLDKVKTLRKEVTQQKSRAHLEDVLARVALRARDVERDRIVAWLGQSCGMSGHDDRWCPACSFRADIANAIRDGKHRPALEAAP